MSSTPPTLQVHQPTPATIGWLLDSDPAIRWQVMQDLIGAPPETVATERTRVATAGWGAQLLALQRDNGRWGGAAWNRGWNSTMHVLMLLRALGLVAGWIKAQRDLGLVHSHVTWQEYGRPECANHPFFVQHNNLRA